MRSTMKSGQMSSLAVDHLPQRLEGLIGDPGTTVIVIVGYETAAELGLVKPPHAPAPSRNADRHSALARRRLDVGLAQRDLAHQIGVQPSTVSRWERGITRPVQWARDHLCRILGLTYAELNALLDETEPAPVRVLHAVESSDGADAPDEIPAGQSTSLFGLIRHSEGT
jgi:transcriptional regulator with XRE-family HTH domain